MKEASGKFVTIEGERYYEIQHFDAMPHFFISIASDSDIWMYLSSLGSLSAGRRNPDNALFPYYTDDKIADSASITGSKTIIRLKCDEQRIVWEPFSESHDGLFTIERSIAKFTTGNKLLFKEINHDLGLTFSYLWTNSDRFGIIRKSVILNHSETDVELEMLDGLQNVLPSGVDRQTQNEYSTLVDGYKKTELVNDSSLVLFRMEAVLVDRAEPSESLRVNTVWSIGGTNVGYLLSSLQLKKFRLGEDVVHDVESKGVRGAYFVHSKYALKSGESISRFILADLNKDADQVAALYKFINTENNIIDQIEDSITNGTSTLKGMVQSADGIQFSDDEHGTARHYSNTLFNVMRGGIYKDEYQIESENFAKHVKHFNKYVADKHESFLSQLNKCINYRDLQLLVQQQNDPQLYRLFQEYLPLTFSRRHGDPSRPWNNFNIRIKDENGNKLLSWQGNWRDIFQNWEALSLSFPGYINSIIAKFLNASTMDGYNPYRITNEGIDWEEIEPDNPWSNIGYWGDHQIIYLLKLLELSGDHYPESFKSMIEEDKFAYANVPYRIKWYKQIVENPKDTILFDSHLHHQIIELEKQMGSDGRLVLDKHNEVRLVSFTEKILVTLLAKLTNMIPAAGIWMNTLRPEWNDANNALVGTGASMVTLYYMRRFVNFLQNIYLQSTTDNWLVGSQVFDLLNMVQQIFLEFSDNTIKGFDTLETRCFVDKMGLAAEKYRNAVYVSDSNESKAISKTDINQFFSLTLKHLDFNIGANKRNDKLYHAYNLVKFTDDRVEIRYLSQMLEGQVAVLSSGKLSVQDCLDLLEALRNSALYRADQHSYMLYPNKQLPLFMDKNIVPDDESGKISLLVTMLEKGDKSIISKDAFGRCHFNSEFNNAGFLLSKIESLKASGKYEITPEDKRDILELYEKVFDHQSFTGRSGTFYKYEGLGSIYWHMVSKLLLAIGENIDAAHRNGDDGNLIAKLKEYYFEVKNGIGANKNPAEYGSFPFDPYSHTPMMSGVQQPGMTGQVKEDIISRFMELGIRVKHGMIHFNPLLLRKDEFTRAGLAFAELRFTYCSVPFIYRIDGKRGVEVLYTNGSSETNENFHLSSYASKLIFNRSGEIQSVIVHFGT